MLTEEQFKLWKSKEGLPTRLYNALLRNGFGSSDSLYGSAPPLNRSRLRIAIAEGVLVQCRGISKGSVETLRLWLANYPADIDIPKLLPCPFCGKHNGQFAYPYHQDVLVECASCEAQGPRVWIGKKLANFEPESKQLLVAEAAELWNRRAELPA